MKETARRRRPGGVVWLVLALATASPAEVQRRVVPVRDDRSLRAALSAARAGTTISLAPGTYRGGLHARGLAGAKDAAIVIEGRDPNDPPQFRGGALAMHLSDCRHVVLRNLLARGFPANGMNIDDGGSFDTPAHHVVLEDVTILDTGPKGNRDGLKLSGVDHFVLRRCRIEGWGGSSIDMVGCHHGVIEDCTFVAKAGFSQATGIQMKGGSSDVLVQSSFFDGRQGGGRAVNIGGGTGLRYFRPKPDDYEATRITVAGNRFVGSRAAVAWATARGGHVHHNTIYLPQRWPLRILQEQPVGRFRPCHGGLFENNLVVYGRVASVVNVGPNTAPRTFRFRRNAWFRRGGGSRPRLPAPETDGVHDVDPRLAKPGTAAMAVTSKDPRLQGIGADAYVRPKPPDWVKAMTPRQRLPKRP